MDETKTIVKAFSTDVTVDEGERAVTARISTNAVDRDGEVLIPQGMDAKDYQKNPVIFFNHAWSDYHAETNEKIPVGKCVALKREDDAVIAKMVFATRPATHPEGEEWLPDTLFALYQQGVMNAFSVGFTPSEYRPATDKDIEKFGAGCRRVYSKWKLFEVSAVPLPANQEAVALAVSKHLLTQEAADKMFAADTKSKAAATPTAEPESPTAKEVREFEADSPPQPTKRLVFFVEPPMKAAKVDTSTKDVIAKKRGAIYYV